ncbi:MAG: diguanylate cyclase domain-containing protein [Thiohalospira sp.]
MAYEGSALPSVTAPTPAPLTADRWARLDSDPGCYAIHMDAHGDLLGITEALSRRLGFAPGDLVGAPVAALLHPDHRRTANAHRVLVGRAGELVELAFSVHHLPDGELLWITTAPDEDAGDDTPPTDGHNLRRLLDHLTDAILLLDGEGRVRYLNPAAASLLGRDRTDEAPARHWRDLLAVADPAARMVAGCLAGREGGEQTLTLRIGHRYHRAALACSPLPGEEGTDGAVLRLTTGRGAGLDEEIVYRARHDAVTGLHNRWEFEARLEEQLHRNEPASLALLDLDQFKAVNDHAGHAAGDALLRQVASTLAARLRTGDELARLGGDEFALLLPDCEPGAAAERLEEALAGMMSQPFQFDGRHFAIGFSAGVAPVVGDDPATILAAADRACYRAKAGGRGRVAVAIEETPRPG